MSHTKHGKLATWITVLAGVTIPAASANDATFSTLYSFGKSSTGAYPLTNLVKVGGLLYGTTAFGGSRCGKNGCGTIFSVDPKSGSETVLYSFRGKADGQTPVAGLISVGTTLYGTTTEGGGGPCPNGGCGTVFSYDAKLGVEKVIYAFQNASDGRAPEGLLTYADGVLYGTIGGGGKYGYGNVFAITLSNNAEKVVYSFKSASDGEGAFEELLSVNHMLYGTTEAGGSGCGQVGCGTVFSLNPKSGVKKTLYEFTGGSDGWQLQSGLVAIDHKLYGTAYLGGYTGTGFCARLGCGTVYSIDLTTGQEKTVYAFKGLPDVYFPSGDLAVLGGLLYGTSANGGTADSGTIFSVDPATGKERLLHSFTGGAGGSFPENGISRIGHALYGSALGNSGRHCTVNCGSIFEYKP